MKRLGRRRDVFLVIHPEIQQLGHVHSEKYLIWDPLLLESLCGPCFFRTGFINEIPSRVTIRQGTGTFGAPAIDPRLVTHLELSFGLVPPLAGEPLPRWRKRRDRVSVPPEPRLFPFISSLWNLMNYQPPLAKPLVKFCQGMDEPQIAEEMDLSLYNVHERLAKAVRTAHRYLKHGEN